MRQQSAQNTLEGINEGLLVDRGVNAERVCDAPQGIIGASGVDLRAAQLSVGLPFQALTKHSFTWRPRVRPVVLLTPRDRHIRRTAEHRWGLRSPEVHPLRSLRRDGFAERFRCAPSPTLCSIDGCLRHRPIDSCCVGVPPGANRDPLAPARDVMCRVDHSSNGRDCQARAEARSQRAHHVQALHLVNVKA